MKACLFTGHRGCGKSTELQRLKKSWDGCYRVIYVESDVEIDSKDADLYLVIIKQVSDDLAKLGLSFDRNLLTTFENWFKDITDETEESVEKSVSLATVAELYGYLYCADFCGVFGQELEQYVWSTKCGAHGEYLRF